MEMYFVEADETAIQYTLKTEPPEAMYWATYKLKKSDIKIISKMDRSQAAMYREKILASIHNGEQKANARTTTNTAVRRK